MKKGSDIILMISILLLIILLFWQNLMFGEANIGRWDVVGILLGETAEYNSWSYIVESRLNRSLIAIFGGGALAVAGLILQVFFRNPLAGPGVLGITSGASLGVAVVILGGLSLGGLLANMGLIAPDDAFSLTIANSVGIVVFGALGALLVLFLLLLMSRFVKSQITLLVIGLMIGYFTGAFVNMLFLWADQAETREFVIWGMGSFEGLSSGEMRFFVFTIIAFAAISIWMVKSLNGLVLGEDYARSLGINLKRQKRLMIVVTSVLAAIVTAFCGPISFIGIAVPQLIRVVTKSKNHALIIPLCFLGGGLLGIAADLMVRLAGNALPLNTVTALIGAPIIIWTIIKMNKRFARM